MMSVAGCYYAVSAYVRELSYLKTYTILIICCITRRGWKTPPIGLQYDGIIQEILVVRHTRFL